MLSAVAGTVAAAGRCACKWIKELRHFTLSTDLSTASCLPWVLAMSVVDSSEHKFQRYEREGRHRLMVLIVTQDIEFNDSMTVIKRETFVDSA